MPLHKHLNWNLLIGATIEVRRLGRAIRTGTVDDAMPDSSALWLASDGVQPRTIYEAALNYEAWVGLKQLTGTGGYRMTWSRLYPDCPQASGTLGSRRNHGPGARGAD